MKKALWVFSGTLITRVVTLLESGACERSTTLLCICSIMKMVAVIALLALQMVPDKKQ